MMIATVKGRFGALIGAVRFAGSGNWRRDGRRQG